MKKSFAFFIPLILTIFLLSACAVPQPTYTLAPSATDTTSPSKEPQPTDTLTPTMTEAPIPTTTETPAPTGTQAPLVFSVLNASGQYQMSSQFTLYANTAGGNYSASATYNGSGVVSYQCKFDVFMTHQLVCNGGPVPFNKTVYIKLINSDTNEVVYNNTMKFAGFVPTPTGMDCQVEPQWNGRIPAHQQGVNCFAMTCMQNGVFFYGNNNTCENPWPFDWNFYHPLYTPPAP